VLKMIASQRGHRDSWASLRIRPPAQIARHRASFRSIPQVASTRRLGATCRNQTRSVCGRKLAEESVWPQRTRSRSRQVPEIATSPSSKDGRNRPQMRRTSIHRTVQLGELVAAAFDWAAQYSSDPRMASLLATRAEKDVLRRSRKGSPSRQVAGLLPVGGISGSCWLSRPPGASPARWPPREEKERADDHAA
jgi:hypothetical protein